MDEGIYIDAEKVNKINKLDSIIFDCDGVLNDVSNSYDLEIKKTVDFITSKFASIKLQVTTEMIDSCKKSGGFNDEVDVKYALILVAVASQKTGKSFPELVFEVAKNTDSTGIVSVEK